MAVAKRSTVARKAPKTQTKSVALNREDKKYNAVMRILRAETKAPLPKSV